MAFPPTTPARPLPGAFLNTPAIASRLQTREDPVQRQLFSTLGRTQLQGGDIGLTPPNKASPAAPMAPPVTNAPLSKDVTQNPADAGLVPSNAQPGGRSENVPPVTRAAKAINVFLQSDKSFPDLDSYCRQGASSDYELSDSESSRSFFHKTHMHPIPNQVFEHYNAGELQTLMGLFAEVNHAWVAIDNSLFLWDYTQTDPELIGFEEQASTIQAVALVPPKPGIFVKTITHILVVATTAEIILLGVSASDTAAGTRAVTLYQTRMVLPLRGNDVRVISGSASGRIFFGGSSDVDLNELYYQSEEKWFSNRCGKINHTNPGWSSVVTLQSSFWSHRTPEHLTDIVIDDTRNLVYTLSSKSTIRTYYMDGPDRLSKVIEKEKVHCLRDIAHLITQSNLLNDRMSITSISAISKQEASKLHLMALTDTGCRLFFSATSASSYLYGSQSSLAPQSMQVQFIKFPPSQSPRQAGHLVQPGQQIGEAAPELSSTLLLGSRQGVRYAPGYFLDLFRSGENADLDVLFISGPDTARIKRTSPNNPLQYFEQACWIDMGSRAEAVGLSTPPFAAALQPLGFGNELAVQFDETSSEFAILTNTGVHVVRRRRLVDAFSSVIRDAPGDDILESETRRLIQLYGRVETVSSALAVACGQGGDGRTAGGRAIDQVTEDRARGIFVDFGGQPRITETDGTALTTDSVRLSSRHDALALYLSRLVRKLWKAPVIRPTVPATGGFSIESEVPLSRLNATQMDLERLRKFIDTNRMLIQGMSGPSDLQRMASRQEEIALQAENQALHALQKLMECISEGISFVLMMFDELVTDIFLRLDDAARQQLKELTYEKLFSTSDGKDLAKLLVKAIVNRNIESGSNVETVADGLRRRCGSFCSPDDVVIFKAQEQLKKASEQPANSTTARSLLHESLKLFERVAGSLTFPNLQTAVGHFTDLNYYAGAIQLCLVVARERDRGNGALTWVNDGKPASDARVTSYNERKQCYDLIHEILQKLDSVSSRQPELMDGKPTLIATKRREAYDVVNGSDDEVFHLDLYEWYIAQGWTDRILAIDSPHVVTFLQRLASTNLEHADLLCRFYTNRSRFFDAAVVQVELAASDFRLGIKDRIRLLSLAKANASVGTVGVSHQQQQMLSREVTDLLDIANIQDELLERLKVDARINPEMRAKPAEALDGRVLDISELYNEYAAIVEYHDLCLLIYYTANYRNPMTISTTWSNLIQQTHDEIESRLEAADADPDAETPAPPMPYEVVSSKVQNLAHQTSLDSFVFPIDTLLPELCRYAVVFQQDATIGAEPIWPVQLFLNLGVSHDMVVRVLERVFDTQDYGFSGTPRTRLVELIAFAVNSWLAEVRRRGGNGKGGSVGAWVGELLARCEGALPPPGQGSNKGGADLADVRRTLRTLRREVAGLIERVATGSLRFN